MSMQAMCLNWKVQWKIRVAPVTDDMKISDFWGITPRRAQNNI